MDLSKYFDQLTPLPAEDIEYFVVHHSAGNKDLKIEDIHREHQALGWTCVGYHAYILPDGTIQYGRPSEYQGAHAYGHNHESLGVCLAGYFHHPVNDEPTGAQIHSLMILLNRWTQKFGSKKIVGHRFFGETACPGDILFEMLPDIEKAIKSISSSEEYKYQNLVKKYSEKYGFNESFIKAVIEQESNFKPQSVSIHNAKGLMQLLPGTFEDCKKALNLPANSDIFEPEINIQCGCYYYSWLRKQLGVEKEKGRAVNLLLLSAYNQGANNDGLKYAKAVLNRIK